jgi:hypothetical protein
LASFSLQYLTDTLQLHVMSDTDAVSNYNFGTLIQVTRKRCHDITINDVFCFFLSGSRDYGGNFKLFPVEIG